jgi:hypothetical protein
VHDHAIAQNLVLAVSRGDVPIFLTNWYSATIGHNHCVCLERHICVRSVLPIYVLGKCEVYDLIYIRRRTGSQMSFTSLKLKPESGANRIKSADDAYSFMAHLRLSYRSKPHWQVARQALDNVYASNLGEIHAWQTFRAAVLAEGWLTD